MFSKAWQLASQWQEVPKEEEEEDDDDATLSIDLSGMTGTALPTSSSQKIRRACGWKDITLLLLVIYNTLLTVTLLWKFERPLSMSGTTKDYTWSTNTIGATATNLYARLVHLLIYIIIVTREVSKQQHIPARWANEYSAATIAGMDEVDRNWDNIDASIGLVSISHKLAAKNGLPPTMEDPRDHGNGIYILEGYHSLHCLTVIRHTMLQLAKGEPLDIPFGHSTHCFSSLLQSILCNTDTTLLYQKAGSGPGDGQMRKCRNWPAMRDWAKEHSACMVTNSSGIASQDIEGCDKVKAGDGVILSDWPEG
ncbi:hypothetical protein M426DRAFT_14306 [Hypoxylon sp. CI-4A]|nr:hypothetical protein M426DRAFT_14306 [Hypoxylon sp. CI-4A]